DQPEGKEDGYRVVTPPLTLRYRSTSAWCSVMSVLIWQGKPGSACGSHAPRFILLLSLSGGSGSDRDRWFLRLYHSEFFCPVDDLIDRHESGEFGTEGFVCPARVITLRLCLGNRAHQLVDLDRISYEEDGQEGEE